MRALVTGAAASGIGGAAACIATRVLAAERSAMIPLGRSGTVEDVAGMVAFLPGKDAQFITGENIFVDGGFARSSLARMVRRL